METKKRKRDPKTISDPGGFAIDKKRVIDTKNEYKKFDFGSKYTYENIKKNSLAIAIYSWAVETNIIAPNTVDVNDEINRINAWLHVNSSPDLFSAWCKYYERPEVDFKSNELNDEDVLTLKVIKTLSKLYSRKCFKENEYEDRFYLKFEDELLEKLYEIEFLLVEVQKEVDKEIVKAVKEHYDIILHFNRGIESYYRKIYEKKENIKRADKDRNASWGIDLYFQFIGVYCHFLKMAYCYKVRDDCDNDCLITCYEDFVQNELPCFSKEELMPELVTLLETMRKVDLQQAFEWNQLKKADDKAITKFYLFLVRKDLEILIQIRKHAIDKVNEMVDLLIKNGIDVDKDIKEFDELNKLYEKLLTDDREVEVDTEASELLDEVRRVLKPYKKLIAYNFLNERNEKTLRALKYFDIFFGKNVGKIKIEISKFVLLLRQIYILMYIEGDGSTELGKKYLNRFRKKRDVVWSLMYSNGTQLSANGEAMRLVEFLFPMIAAPKNELLANHFISLYSNATKIIEILSEYNEDNHYIFNYLLCSKDLLEKLLLDIPDQKVIG